MRIETPEQLARAMAEKGIGIDQAYEERTGCPWDYDAKSFEEMGADALDIIETMMDLEKRLDCEITDLCCEMVESMDPNDLIIWKRRQRRLGDLGI
jgi:hypothetical protein